MIGGTLPGPPCVGHAVLMNCTASPAALDRRWSTGSCCGWPVSGGVRPPLTGPVPKAFLGPTTFRTGPTSSLMCATAWQRSTSGRDAGRFAVSCPSGRTSAVTGRLRTPVLVVAGVEDATFPLQETVAMAEAIPDGAFAVLEGVAHLAALENSLSVDKLVDEFVFRG